MKQAFVFFLMLTMAYSIEDFGKNLTTSYNLFIHTGPSNKINAIKFWPQGNDILYEDTEDGKQIVHWMNLTNGEVRFVEEFTHDEIVKIEFSLHHFYVYTVGWDGIKVWDLDQPDETEPLAFFKTPNKVYDFMESPNGLYLFAVGEMQNGESPIYVFSLTTFQRVDSGKMIHDGPIYAIDAYEGKRFIATGGGDGVVKIWDPVTEELKTRVFVPKNVNNKTSIISSISINQLNGDILVGIFNSIEKDNIGLVDFDEEEGSFEMTRTFRLEGKIASMGWLPFTNRVAIASYNTSNLVIVNPYLGVLTLNYTASSQIYGMDISKDGTKIALGGNGMITVLNLLYDCSAISFVDQTKISDDSLLPECPCLEGFVWFRSMALCTAPSVAQVFLFAGF